MGGFFKSKDLERIYKEWMNEYYFPYGVTEEVEEALEQCIVLTKWYEKGKLKKQAVASKNSE